MSNRITARYNFDVQSIDTSVRQTNALLRGANALRLTARDIKQTLQNPNLSRVMWTLIQILRTYTALRRIMKLFSTETMGVMGSPVKIGRGVTGGGTPLGGGVTASIPDLSINVEAFANGTAIPIERVDLTGITEKTRIEVQRIIEEDMHNTVNDAKMLLNQRIIHREQSTGRLESEITWHPEFPGATLLSPTPYAFWVEEGQRTFSGHHYLKDAVDLSIPRLSEKIKAEIRQLIFN